MNTSLIIPVHSFVDLITNSSSEIFIAANQDTIKAIKKLVDSLIAATGGTAKADDLFTFDLAYLCYDQNLDEVLLSKAEIKAKRKEVDEIVNNPEEYTENEVEDAKMWEFFGDNQDGPSRCNVRVIVKDPTNKNAKVAAEILSDLTSFFNIEESYE